MRKVDFELNFKKDLSNIEIAGVDSIIGVLARDNEEYITIDSDTVYTSSSSYAMLGIEGRYISEDDLYLNISHFAITENNMLIMVCEDRENKYYYYEIEPKDFY